MAAFGAAAGGSGAVPMSGVEGGEDRVVAQYPVYLTRGPDPGGALYLLQSPLRPAARPYELEECDEVRFKARASASVMCAGDAGAWQQRNACA
jgi:hypothetical protein